MILNIDKATSIYPNNDNKFGRYSHIKGEIKDAFFNGSVFYYIFQTSIWIYIH